MQSDDTKPCTTCGRQCKPYTNSGACKSCFTKWLNKTSPHPPVCRVYRSQDEREDELATCGLNYNPWLENATRQLEERGEW